MSTTSRTIFTITLTTILGAFIYFLRNPGKALRNKLKKVVSEGKKDDRELFI